MTATTKTAASHIDDLAAEADSSFVTGHLNYRSIIWSNPETELCQSIIAQKAL
jgi:hypothetical protein